MNECEDPGVCGTARCENKEGSYDCLCDIGYVYDNETKSCVGKCVYTHTQGCTQKTCSFMRAGLQPQQDLMQLCCGGRERNAKTFGEIRIK